MCASSRCLSASCATQSGEGYTWKYDGVGQGAGAAPASVRTGCCCARSGARAREMLILAAAQRWQVDTARAQPSPAAWYILQPVASRATVSFAAQAATPQAPQLRANAQEPGGFSHHRQADARRGRTRHRHRCRRLRNRRAPAGSEAMRYWRAVRGSTAVSTASMRAQALKVPGVRQVVRIDAEPTGKPYTVLASAIAVVADSTWAAIQVASVSRSNGSLTFCR